MFWNAENAKRNDLTSTLRDDFGKPCGRFNAISNLAHSCTLPIAKHLAVAGVRTFSGSANWASPSTSASTLSQLARRDARSGPGRAPSNAR